uniref:HTH CENPB-type domain-containing protein n=1 Tax=Plectus sambesii TaxID=2011161 RepID=A0A914VDN8_9BILA
MAPPSKVQRKTLSVEDKIRLLDLAKDNSDKISDLLSQFTIGLSTFYKIKAQETALRDASIANKNLKRKRSKASKYDDLNQALTQWFHQVRVRNSLINGPIVMEKAKQLADMMEVDFEPSIGWLGRWKENENITFHTVQGEKDAADVPGAEHWIQDVLPIALEGYAKRDIYNADETSLFYKALLKGKFAVRGDKPTAGKQQKAHLMVLLLCNQDGSDKQMFVVGKAAKPRCFANIRRPPLPYYSNAKAWMLSGLWSQISAELDKKLRAQNRKIVLVADNASCHKLVDVKLTNIEVVFLPPNTTCLIQPLDQGIIHNLKVFYHQQLL